jgi:prophage antirepressor-like protein
LNELKKFSSSEFGELNIMFIDGKEYFSATKCAEILGYANPRDAIQKRCREDGVAKCDVIDSLGRKQQMKFISEGNLYRLIVSSKLPTAEKFERWVFEEILPSIRKNGTYSTVDINEVIVKTAAAVVSEVFKQLAPVLNAQKSIIKNQSDKTVQRFRYKTPSKVETLKPELRATVDDMICSGKYSCQQIANYIMNYSEMKITSASVNRYAHRHFWD